MPNVKKHLLSVVMLLVGITAAQAAQTVEIAETEHGVVTLETVSPSAGDVVTITVTPDPGYEISKSDITVEATIDPGMSQAPAQGAPQVGYYIDLQGETPTDPSQQATYTFVMPDQPFGVLITAKFSKGSFTGVESVSGGKVASTHYVTPSGRVANAPMPGINLVVVAYTNGTRTVTKRTY